MLSNNWYVITGGPSTGKTTLLAELEKLGHKTIPEAARSVIDQAIDKGISVEELRSDEQRFQADVIRLKEKIEASLDKSLLTFFDRGMQDSLAYIRHYGFSIEDWVMAMMDKASYRKVFLLEPLPVFQRDYARTEDHDFAKSLNKLLYVVYSEFNMEPVNIPAGSLEDRVRMILDMIERP